MTKKRKKKKEPWLCTECGKAMKGKVLKEYLYEGVGVPVMLRDVERMECHNGHSEVGIPRMAELHKAIAKMVASRRRGLEPNEIKFLRKYLGFSGKDFAAEMGVDPVTVSKWENGHQPMGPQSQKLLRIMALTRKPLSRYKEAEEMDPIGFEVQDGKWAATG